MGFFVVTQARLENNNKWISMRVNCSKCQNKNKKQLMYLTCSELVVFMFWTGKSMNINLSCFRLIDVRISAFDKEQP